LRQPVAYEVTKATLHSVASDRRTDRPAHHETHRRLGISLTVGRQNDMGNQSRLRGLDAPTNRDAEVLAAAHAMDLIEQRAQADSLERPLRRRDDRIERPARVRMRSRKPCFLARRRLFGWYVRLLTELPHESGGGAGTVWGWPMVRCEPVDGHRSPTESDLL
jgi:hypothetical protein